MDNIPEEVKKGFYDRIAELSKEANPSYESIN